MNASNSLKTTSRMAILCLAALFLGVTASGQILKSSEVKKLTASAKTAADHMKLAKHYEAVAAKHEADAKEHEALAEYYAKHPTGQEQKRPLSGHTAEHCRHYAEHCHRAAAAAKEMAAAHTEMAKQEAK